MLRQGLGFKGMNGGWKVCGCLKMPGAPSFSIQVWQFYSILPWQWIIALKELAISVAMRGTFASHHR